jgi:hypothetical protein
MRQPPKKMKDAALLTARHYLSLRSDLRGSAQSEARMLSRLNTHAARIAKACNRLNPGIGTTADMVLGELHKEAARLGPLTPILGQDM